MEKKNFIAKILLPSVLVVGMGISFYSLYQVKTELKLRDAQIQQLQTQIDAQKKEINDVTYERNYLKDENAKLQSTDASHQATIQQLNSKIDDLSSRGYPPIESHLNRVASSDNTNWQTFRATYYNQGGTAKNGKRITGSTIAVDPRVIPLGSTVEVKWPDGHTEIRHADDTGGAIYGHRIDVYTNTSTRDCNNRGVDMVQVRVL